LLFAAGQTSPTPDQNESFGNNRQEATIEFREKLVLVLWCSVANCRSNVKLLVDKEDEVLPLAVYGLPQPLIAN